MSIHIGVNHPRHRRAEPPLQYSETTAWRMAELASCAGYDSLQVLRGAAATRAAVHQALTGAAGVLTAGDTLLLTFSGHGVRERDLDGDERDGWDEAWCLADGIVLDDTLAGYWSLFERGVRIVVVAESCYSGGIGRTGDLNAPPTAVAAGGYGAPRWRGGTRSGPVDAHAGNPCIAEPQRHHDGIRASVLLLCASGEDQTARDGVFTRYLLEMWNDGFRGSYCDLYRKLRQRVLGEHCAQEMHIVMMGAPDPDFSMAPAFHLDRAPHRTGLRGPARLAV